MNYMGTGNMNTLTPNNCGSFQPAMPRLTAEQRMFVRNHPNQVPYNDYNNNLYYNYGRGCGQSGNMNQMGNMNSTANANNNSGNGMMNNNGMMVQPSNTAQNNTQMTTQVPGSSQVISLRPETMTNTDFLPAYLNQYIGHWIRADFFIGNTTEQRVGVLHEVGASYIIIEAIEPQTLIVCDIFSLRFVTIILDEDYGRLVRV